VELEGGLGVVPEAAQLAGDLGLHLLNGRLDLHRFCSGHVLMLGGPLFEGHGGFPAEG